MLRSFVHFNRKTLDINAIHINILYREGVKLLVGEAKEQVFHNLKLIVTIFDQRYTAVPDKTVVFETVRARGICPNQLMVSVYFNTHFRVRCERPDFSAFYGRMKVKRKLIVLVFVAEVNWDDVHAIGVAGSNTQYFGSI